MLLSINPASSVKEIRWLPYCEASLPALKSQSTPMLLTSPDNPLLTKSLRISSDHRLFTFFVLNYKFVCSETMS